MNKYFFSGSVLICFFLITIVTTSKVINIHQDKLLLVKNKYLIETAKKCINENNCESNKVTLKELYALEYLDKESNPVTKEYYSEESYIELKNNEYVFIDIY